MANDDVTGAAVKVDVIVTGHVPTPYDYVFRSKRGNRVTRLGALLRPNVEVLQSPCLAYAVRHPTAGDILIDTGMHPDATNDLRKDFGLAMSLLFRNLRPAADPFDRQLRALGIDPGGIEQVVMTHLHVDHTSGMRLLPRAEFVCSRKEWSAAQGRLGAAGGYVRHHLPDRSRMRLLDFDADGRAHGPFSRTIDLLGDGSIRLVSTPGHTSGHLSVLLQVEGGRQVLVVGDALYTLRSMREEILPLLTVDDDLYRRSLHEIKAFAAGDPDATLVPSHDPTAWHALSAATARDAGSAHEAGGRSVGRT